MSSQSAFFAGVLSLTVLSAASVGLVRAEETIQGKLVADQRGRVSAPLTGERSTRVEEMRVRAGDRVKQGDVLARLSTEQLEADKNVAKRAMEEALAAVEVEKSNVARRKLDFDRRAALKGSPSFNRAALEEAELDLKAVENQLKSAQSLVARRTAEVARFDLEIRLAEIKAPYDGIVAEVLTDVGATVTQQAPDLVTLVNLNRVEIAVEAQAGIAQKLRPGASVEYAISAGDKKHPAKVRTLLPPGGAKPGGAIARLELNASDLPALIRHDQPVQVFISQ